LNADVGPWANYGADWLLAQCRQSSLPSGSSPIWLPSHRRRPSPGGLRLGDTISDNIGREGYGVQNSRHKYVCAFHGKLTANRPPSGWRVIHSQSLSASQKRAFQVACGRQSSANRDRRSASLQNPRVLVVIRFGNIAGRPAPWSPHAACRRPFACGVGNRRLVRKRSDAGSLIHAPSSWTRHFRNRLLVRPLRWRSRSDSEREHSKRLNVRPELPPVSGV
jgi:hypothetical protein